MNNLLKRLDRIEDQFDSFDPLSILDDEELDRFAAWIESKIPPEERELGANPELLHSSRNELLEALIPVIQEWRTEEAGQLAVDSTEDDGAINL